MKAIRGEWYAVLVSIRALRGSGILRSAPATRNQYEEDKKDTNLSYIASVLRVFHLGGGVVIAA